MAKKLLAEIHPGEILLEDFMMPMAISARQLAAADSSAFSTLSHHMALTILDACPVMTALRRFCGPCRQAPRTSRAPAWRSVSARRPTTAASAGST
jgi:hypothetical protein